MASPRLRQIRDRLPSLWRPEEHDDQSLLARYLRAVADLLERLNGEASGVMQAHWFPYADQALFSPFYRLLRVAQEKPLPQLGDADLKDFPYISDLARLGALLPVLPWGGPPAQREKVEQYRGRIARTVALYRNGLGTVSALEQMVLAQLPDDPDQPFTVEEFPPVPVSPRQAATRGAPDGVLGPLMRWQLVNSGDAGLGPAAPTVYVQGMKPATNSSAGVAGPLVELYAAGSERIRLGIAYDGTLQEGETLRLRTAYASWIGSDAGLRSALSSPGESSPASPAAPGPWHAAPGAPEAPVTALLQSRDLTVWAAVDSGDAGDTGALWRFDGETWTEALTDLPRVRCLALDGGDLLAGTASGLLRVPLHPEEAVTPEEPNGPEVNAILRVKGGGLWLGTAEGLDQKDFPLPFEVAGPVHALHQDATGTVYLGTDLGLLQFQPGLGHGYWYSGKSHSEQVLDWQRFEPGNGLDPGRVFLPPVRAIRRGPDSSLWLGTDHGIARYRARSAGGLTYTTLLEAFPDLASGRVFAIEEDARGTLWFATEQGLFRYDGRDWWHAREGQEGATALVRLGPLEEPKHPVFWRFQAGSWERLDSAAKSQSWIPHTGTPVPAEPAIRALLWTRQAVADLGTWDDGASAFTRTGGAPGKLRVRHKPDEQRIVDGGLPAVPSLPPGRSVWRYLALESEGVPEPQGRPAWTVEGRFLPPPPEDTDRVAPLEGRYSEGRRKTQVRGRLDLSAFDDAVFAYPPEARVWFAWEERHAPSVLVRLQTTAPGEAIDPAVLDRVWQGIQQVRPAGVRALLAVDEEIVRGA